MRKLKYILFVLLIAMMLAPGIQKAIQLFEVKPLHGDFVLAKKPEFSTVAWFNASFQQQYDNYLEEHISFRPLLVRLNNQLDFSLYRKANAEGVTIGKDDFLYEYDYIRAYTGKDFVGEKIIREKMNRLKFLQDYLKDSLDIDLVLVFEPGKASFYPEYIPDRFLTEIGPSTNYKSLYKTAREIEVNFLDLNQYFLQLKVEAKYPLFPKYGIHWTLYGMSFAADTLLNTIEQLRNIELVSVKHDSVFTSWQPLRTDNDVEKPMNLLFPLPADEMAYPVFEFGTDSTAIKPLVLAVADSYYWSIYNTGLPQHVFANKAFWYFNAKVYPEPYSKPLYVKDIDLKKEIEKQDVIFLMVTERFMYKFDWGFIDDLYRLYTLPGLQSPVYDEVTKNLSDEAWFVAQINRARADDISLEDVLWSEAKYRLKKKDKTNYLQHFRAAYFEDLIKADNKWSATVAANARKRNISFDEMLSLDANYIFWKNHPELHKNIHRRLQFEEVIRKDSLLLKQAKDLANFYHCPLDRMIRYQAGLMLGEEQ